MRIISNYLHPTIIITIIALALVTGFHFNIKKDHNQVKIEPKLISDANAHYQFAPSSGQLITGTEQTILAATASSTEGVNTGSWKGTLADDNFHWAIASTTGGYDVQLISGGAQLNGANMFSIQTEFDLDATAPSTLVQICDWVTSTSVDNAADAQCTTGGWRTLNNIKTAITTTTPTAYIWQVYDGYWSNGSDTPISTPLSNFINGSNEIRIRYYSTTNTTSVVSIDYLRINAIVNPIYSAADTTNLGSGSVTGDYTNTTVITQGASDDTRYQVAGTAGSVADMYFSFKNVKTYTGMNTIMVRAEYSCSSAGITHRPKIYNFNTSSWEDLSTTSINCSTTDTGSVFAKNNITISDYISSGEIRVGWRGLSNSTTALRFDQIYIMVGSTNSDSGGCEISFGSNNAGDCTNTRTIDTTATDSVWKINTEDESNSFGHDFYADDNDQNGTVGEAASANINFSVTVPENAAVTGHFIASRQMSGVAGTVGVTARDYAGGYDSSGGWIYMAMVGTTALNYTDNITVGGVSWGGPTGGLANPEDHIDTVNNLMNIQLRTASAGATSNNSINQWDFAMASIAWTEDASHPSSSYQFQPTGEQLVTGTAQTILAATAASNEGVNIGSWRGTLDNDDYHWAVASTTSGYDAQLVFGSVQLNGANKLIIKSEFDLDATAPSTLIQICDWVSTTSVDNAADSQCTGGGWRTINNQKSGITSTSPGTWTWFLYDGFWSNGSNTPISTPLTNFVKSTNEVRLRFYSTTNTTSVVSVDYMWLTTAVNPVYSPASVTNLGSGATTGDYMSVNNITQGSSDDVRLQVAGTAGSVADMYFSFKNVKTYTGMNTIYVNFEVSCSATGINHRPKIYNFNSASWEDLTSSSIACSTSDSGYVFAKNNITISNYVSNGEIRVGWRGLSNATTTLRFDQAKIILGTTNTDTADCEISFGTNNSGDCSATRDADNTTTNNVWKINTEDESNTFGHAYYPFDSNSDAVVEEAGSANIKFNVTLPTYSALTSSYITAGIMSGTAGTVTMNIRDYSGFYGNLGGYDAGGLSGGTTFVFLVDNIQSASYTGLPNSPDDHIDTVNNKMQLRLRTVTPGATSNNSINQWDFAMVSPQYTESKPTYTQSAFRFFNNADSTDVGSPLAAQDTNTNLGAANAAFRLRMLMHLNNDDLRLSQKDFKLQYVGKGTGTCASPSGGTPSSYTDVTGSTLIAYNNNATPTDGAALTTNANDPTHSTDLVRQQTYEESNNFTNSQKIINSGQDALWDFSLKDNSAPQNTTYCFRMVESDGTAFSSYTYPEVTTATYYVSLSLSDTTIGLGPLSPSSSRWATGNTLGSSTQVIAHTINIGTNSPVGYNMWVRGATLTNGIYTIDPINPGSTNPSPGVEKFGIHASIAGGSGNIVTKYGTVFFSTKLYSYGATEIMADLLAYSSSASDDTISCYYLTDISSTTEPGSYTTDLTYTISGQF